MADAVGPGHSYMGGNRLNDDVSTNTDSDDDTVSPDLLLWGSELLQEMVSLVQGPDVHDAASHDESPLEQGPMASAQYHDNSLSDVSSDNFQQSLAALFPQSLAYNGFASNANVPYALGAAYRNSSLFEFLSNCAVSYTHTARRKPMLRGISRVFAEAPQNRIAASDLGRNEWDLQAVQWNRLRISREEARSLRKRLYINYVQRSGGKLSNDGPGVEVIPSGDTYFRHTQTDLFRDVCPAHFQLRNVLACHSRTQAFYPTQRGIMSVNPLSQQVKLAIKFRKRTPITTMAAGEGVLMAGSLDGTCHVKSLARESETSFIRGVMSRAIVTHLEIHNGRYQTRPQAVVACNDAQIKTLDLETMRMVSTWRYERPANCTATSPDRRLRVMVGDYESAYICDAERGNVVRRLTGHRDHGFACAWSDDGWTVATANQDRSLRIWDARKWCDSSGKSTPVCGLYTELAAVRCLRFSPVGSGKPVLVAMEEADYVNIINAQTFTSKQTVDMFGELGGVAFTNEGQDLNVLCCDPSRGGLMQFERAGLEAEPMIEEMSQQRLGRVGMIWNPRTNALASQSTDVDWPYGYNRRIREHLIF